MSGENTAKYRLTTSGWGEEDEALLQRRHSSLTCLAAAGPAAIGVQPKAIQAALFLQRAVAQGAAGRGRHRDVGGF